MTKVYYPPDFFDPYMYEDEEEDQSLNGGELNMKAHKTSIDTKSMTHEEWLKSRRKGIGGSDVPAILGFSPYKTPLDVWYEKTDDGEIVEQEMNPKMKAGLKLEDVIAEWFEEESGLSVRKDHKIRIHKEIPFFIADIDRLILANGEDGPGVLEIKTTSSWVARNWEDGDVPELYYAQLQHYLSVTGYKYGWFAILVDGWDFRAYKVERDAEFIELMNTKLFKFWDMVEKEIMPPPVNENDVVNMYPHGNEDLGVSATKETFETYEELIEIRRQIKRLEKEEERSKGMLQLIMGDAIELNYHGSTLATWKNSKEAVKFDVKSFKIDHPELYETYAKTVPGKRKFLIKKLRGE